MQLDEIRQDQTRRKRPAFDYSRFPKVYKSTFGGYYIKELTPRKGMRKLVYSQRKLAQVYNWQQKELL